MNTNHEDFPIYDETHDKPMTEPNTFAFSSVPIETTRVTISNNMAGGIVGPGGSQIRLIRLEGNAEIEMGEPDDASGDRIISITGSEENIQLVLYLLQQAVRENEASHEFLFRILCERDSYEGMTRD